MSKCASRKSGRPSELNNTANAGRIVRSRNGRKILPAFLLTVFVAALATAAIRAGDDIKTVQGNLGHATAAFTLDVYGHVTDQMKRESADRMERFIRTVSAG